MGSEPDMNQNAIEKARSCFGTACHLLLVTLFVWCGHCDAATQIISWAGAPGNPPAGATNIVALAGGDGHALALRADGKVFAWGQNNFGQTAVPPDITNAVRIVAGSTHSIALLDDGTIRFWGNIYSTGVTNPPVSAISNMVELAIGATAQHALSIRSDGKVAEWGNSSYGLPNVPASVSNVVDAAVASFNSLILRDDGKVVNWGQHFSTLSVAPPPSSATNGIAVASGFLADIVLRADGSVIVWGQSSSPMAIPPEATNIIAVACAGDDIVALRRDHTVVSWADTIPTNHAPANLTNIVAIAALLGGNVAVYATDGPPLLGRLLQPTVAAGTTTRLRALAVSTTPMSYQWIYNGTNLPSGTNATLILQNIQPNQGGIYSLVVSNMFGTVTNSNISITVQPIIVQAPPQNQTVAGGSNVTFGVTLLGQGPFSYQWQFYGTNLAGATKSSLLLTNVQMNQSGPYSVVVSNAFGMTNSASGTLTVVPLFITGGPNFVSTYVGGSALFGVAIAGKGPFSFQWRFFGTNLPYPSQSPITITNAQISDIGPYSVMVSNSFGTVTSSNALLTVVPILITAQPQRQVGFLGQTTVFSITAQAQNPLSYQWRFNGTNLAGATESSLVITNCRYNNSGTYSVELTSGSVTTNSTDVTLAIVQIAAWGLSEVYTNVPIILTNVTAISAGDYHSLALTSDGLVRAWGSFNTSYQTNVPLDLTNVIAISAGSYISAALKVDGTVVVWGNGQTNGPPGLSNVVAIACGSSHVLALKSDGTVVAWGNNYNGQTNVPQGLTNVVAVQAGSDTSLVLKADGSVAAWGYNGNGQTNVPANLTNVVAISVSYSHSLVLTSDGKAVSWGDSLYGVTNIPSQLTNAVAISTGGGFSTAVKSDGKVIAWGNPSNGEINVPPSLGNVRSISSGGYHTLALVENGPLQWQFPLINPQTTNSQFNVSIQSRNGLVYALEYKNSFNDSNWTALPLVAGTGKVLTLTDPTTSGSQRFYRVKEW